MPKTITYTSAINLAEDIWKYSSREEKEKLLVTMGYDLSWSETKTVKELVSRGGGMVANSLKNLALEYLNRSNGKVTITWK